MQLKYAIILALLCGAAVVGIYFYNTSSTSEVVDMHNEREVAVVLTDEGFVPRDIRISAGTRVTFTTTRQNQFWPASDPHPVHTVYAAFDPKRPLSSTESWSFTFYETGTWGYHDHMRSYFTGMVYVE